MLSLLLACAPNPEPGDRTDYAARGAHPAGYLSLEITDPARDRALPLSVWYPADPSEAERAELGFPAEELTTDPERYAALLADAPEGCPTRQTRAAAEALPAGGGPWPLLVFSHCHECISASSFSVAEHLASHGFVVAAPDHVGNTLFDALDGEAMALDEDTLAMRAADIQATLDALLAGASPLLPSLDPERVGVFGHSFGSVTAGQVLQDDPRPSVGLGIAAPVENPLFPSVTVAAIHDPLLLVVAGEDNSITELGNELIRSNFEAANPPVWKAEVADAGHWSFSDLCGLIEDFQPGCGEDMRQTDPDEAFTYLPVSEGLAAASTLAAAFFSETLRGDEGAVERTRLAGVELETRAP